MTRHQAKAAEVCLICRKSDNLVPYTLGWSEVSIHVACRDYHDAKLGHFYKQMVQVRDEEHEATRPLECHYRCMGCATEFLFKWAYCTSCNRYAEAEITNCKPWGKMSQGKVDGCVQHTFEPAPGPFLQCPNCASDYAEWVNYTPPSYLWVNQRDLR